MYICRRLSRYVIKKLICAHTKEHRGTMAGRGTWIIPWPITAEPSAHEKLISTCTKSTHTCARGRRSTERQRWAGEPQYPRGKELPPPPSPHPSCARRASAPRAGGHPPTASVERLSGVPYGPKGSLPAWMWHTLGDARKERFRIA